MSLGEDADVNKQCFGEVSVSFGTNEDADLNRHWLQQLATNYCNLIIQPLANWKPPELPQNRNYQPYPCSLLIFIYIFSGYLSKKETTRKENRWKQNEQDKKNKGV